LSVAHGIAGVPLVVIRVALDLLVYVEEDSKGGVSGDQGRVNRVGNEA